MKLKAPKNGNYCAVVVQLEILRELSNCNNVQAAIIMGNQVIVDKSAKVGDIGLFFPLECQLSAEFLSANNLYRHNNLNADDTKKGYFEDHGRIRCVKFRENKSEGFFIPINSLNNLGKGKDLDIDLKVGDEFDELLDIPICQKYVVKISKTPGAPGSGKGFNPADEYESKICDRQFKFHGDTSQLGRNLHRFTPQSLISITYKLHGTSGISARLTCKRKLKWYEKILKKLKVKILDFEYDYIYSSRNKVRNDNPDKTPSGTDYYGRADAMIRQYLAPGMTFYYEIVGPGVQGTFDYGYEPGEIGIYLYRITITNLVGNIYEFSAKQVQQFCEARGLKAVPELYYGYAKYINPKAAERYNDDDWGPYFLETIKERYNEKDCYMCKNVRPEEGCVVRLEGLDLQVYKQRSNAFLALETRDLDKGIVNIEDEN